jgi:hypothetical protein
MSITFDIDAGIASYVGAAGVGAVWGAGRDAAKAAAIDVAIFRVAQSLCEENLKVEAVDKQDKTRASRLP